MDLIDKMESSDDSLTYAKKKIELARLEMSEVSSGIQSLSVDEKQDSLYLLQLNADLTQHLNQGGEFLTIRGNLNDSAVICTDSKTFEIKEAETSNSLLLLPELSWPEECEVGEFRVIDRKVNGIFHNYFELRNFKPNFKKLKALLEENAFKGHEHEDKKAKNYSIDDLLEFVQCSKDELRRGLETLQTLVLNGFVRILDFDYKFNVLSQIVDVIESNSIPLDKIPKCLVVESLEDLVPKEIVEKCFLWFAHETETDEQGQKFFALDENSVCRIFAEILLRAAGKFHLTEFLESWQKSVPEGMKCDLAQLRGLALTDMNYSPEVIFHFPCDEMPENISDRFSKLFKLKEKWSYEDIVPYLEDRACEGTDVKSLLIKYTRESTKDGIKYYSSKW